MAHANYHPSAEISEAIAGALLGWATAKDDDKEETEQEHETPSNGEGGEGGGGTQHELEG